MVQVDRGIDDDRGQALAQASLFGERDDVLLLFALQFVRVFDHPFQAAERRDQLHGRLLADPRDAGNVVHRVAHEAQDILDLVHALEPPSGADLFRPELLRWIPAPPRLVHNDPVAHQLPEVLVGGHHVRDIALRFGLLGQGADHVIRLIPIGFQHGNM